MDDLKLARRMQQQILGPRRFMAACGCVGIVALYFPKKPWVYVEEWLGGIHLWPGGLSHLPPVGWYDQETGAQVQKERFYEAWLKVTKRCDKYIVIGTKHPDYNYLVAENGDIGLGEVHMPRPKKQEPTWPPKMGELFRK